VVGDGFEEWVPEVDARVERLVLTQGHAVIEPHQRLRIGFNPDGDSLDERSLGNSGGPHADRHL